MDDNLKDALAGLVGLFVLAFLTASGFYLGEFCIKACISLLKKVCV